MISRPASPTFTWTAYAKNKEIKRPLAGAKAFQLRNVYRRTLPFDNFKHSNLVREKGVCGLLAFTKSPAEISVGGDSLCECLLSGEFEHASLWE